MYLAADPNIAENQRQALPGQNLPATPVPAEIEVAPAVLFPTAPVVHVMPEIKRCCGQDLLVQKTREKIILTMTGPFVAHETLGKCSQCPQTSGSGPLLNLDLSS